MSIATATPTFHDEVRAGKRVLSYSQISAFLACRHSWYLRYYLGLHSPRSSDPMMLGSAVHEALAAYMADGVPLEMSIKAWQDRQIGAMPKYEPMVEVTNRLTDTALHSAQTALDELLRQGWRAYPVPVPQKPQDGTTLKSSYPYTYQPDISPLALQEDTSSASRNAEPATFPVEPATIPGVELELTWPLESTVWENFAVHIDLLAQEQRTGRIWLIDYKIRKQFTSGLFEEVNLQAMIYALFCYLHGIEVTGTGTLEIKAEPPADPALNKDGTMSRTRIATTWIHYKRTLIEHGLDPEDYGDMAAKLNTPFSRLTFEYRPSHSIRNVWTKIVQPVAEQMSDIILTLDKYGWDPRIVRNMGNWQCNGCAVRQTCVSGLYDRDILATLAQLGGNPERIERALAIGAF